MSAARSSWLTMGRWRSLSACVLLVYVVTHLGNHALALWSLQAADEALQALSFVWRSTAVTMLLGAAFVLHLVAALHSLWRRRTLRMSRWEWMQLLLGLSIVPLGLTHLVGTRVAHELHGVHTNHFWVLWPMAVDPWQCARQFGLMLAVWTHACIGLHFWWRVKPWYPAVLPYLYAGALLLPALALAGAGVGLGVVLTLMEDPERFRQAVALTRPPTREEVAELAGLSDVLKALALLLLLAALAAGALAQRWKRRRAQMSLQLPDGTRIEAPVGLSVLEAFRLHGVAHASVCGGRGRCSTCRVKVDGPGVPSLPAPGPQEALVLSRLQAPQHVRLACQLCPLPGHYYLTPLLPPSAQPVDAYRGTALAVGDERIIAVMFVDLRGFTALSESRLPYDVVFILNRYFALVGQAVEAAGGRVDKFIGDGVMALFGLACDAQRAARAALQAARRVGEAVNALNQQIGAELQSPLRVGMGLHLGPAIVGLLGHGSATSLTAIGDTVNTASRLESLSKDFHAQLLVSEALLEAAQLSGLPGVVHPVQIRGRVQALEVRVIEKLEHLPLS